MGLTHQIGEKLIKLSLAQSFIFDEAKRDGEDNRDVEDTLDGFQIAG